MSATSPGPWVWLEADEPDDVGPWTICDAASNDLGLVFNCQCATVPTTLEQGRANARLMAAAPLLLVQLQVMLRHYIILAGSGDCGNWNPEEEPEVIAACAAITAATGEPA